MPQRPRFIPVDDEGMAAPVADNGAAVRTVMLALQVLSQRAIVALGNLFTATALASAWWLWHDVMGAPTPMQLVGLGMYAIFILAVEVVRRK